MDRLSSIQHILQNLSIFYNTFSLYRQLSHISNLLNYQLHSLRLICHSISISNATIIASVYILPILDYCNVNIQETLIVFIYKLQIRPKYIIN